ncbi:actin-like protein arp8 [Teratosphaeriaceae sp. CCFEE 6253]|nr:actin-like protein arp8 [Teratosphaeriaceae sp. CCFEE 6253]
MKQHKHLRQDHAKALQPFALSHLNGRHRCFTKHQRRSRDCSSIRESPTNHDNLDRLPFGSTPRFTTMVGKKSGRALFKEEGLQRTDNNMEFTIWPQVPMINQKNYYTMVGRKVLDGLRKGKKDLYVLNVQYCRRYYFDLSPRHCMIP